MDLGDILRTHAGDVALLLGNGIHRHGGIDAWAG